MVMMMMVMMLVHFSLLCTRVLTAPCEFGTQHLKYGPSLGRSPGTTIHKFPMLGQSPGTDILRQPTYHHPERSPDLFTCTPMGN